jgi:hypothetical protein
MALLLNHGYRIIIDNCFSSPCPHKLCSKQNNAIETLHQNRKGIPAEMKSAKLKRGENVSVYKARLMIMKWKNKKGICLTRTTHDEMVPIRIQGQSSH